MIETFIALLLAHLVADFLLQPDSMAQNKDKWPVLLQHTGIVLVSTLLITGTFLQPIVYAVAFAHLIIDALKSRLEKPGLASFSVDQAAHVLTLLIATICAPTLWDQGIWSTLAPPALITGFALLCGFILTVIVGGFVVGLLCAPYTAHVPKDGLPGAGRIIGTLERSLIFVMIFAGQIGSIALLIGAKSILRFSTVNEGREASEYVIIGTLASFGWAILMTLASHWVITLLPPLEIGPNLP
ncbi:MAG: DUF3307 domain-containing protein [Pseudoruegeria sp.]